MGSPKGILIFLHTRAVCIVLYVSIYQIMLLKDPRGCLVGRENNRAQLRLNRAGTWHAVNGFAAMHWTSRRFLAARIRREAHLVTGVTFPEGGNKTLVLEKVCRRCRWSAYHVLSSGMDNSVPAKRQAGDTLLPVAECVHHFCHARILGCTLEGMFPSSPNF